MDAAALVLSKKYTKSLVGVSVRDFGAKGDGETDDREAIQAALDYGSANSMPVFVPPGVYIVSVAPTGGKQRALTVNGNTTIHGTPSSIIKLSDAAPDSTCVFRMIQDNITVRDLVIDGNKQRTSTSYDGDAECISVGSAVVIPTNILIENVTTINALDSGIEVDEGDNIRIINCVVRDCAGDGVQAAGIQVGKVLIDGCVVENCAWARAASFQRRWGGFNLDGADIELRDSYSINNERGLSIDTFQGEFPRILVDNLVVSGWGSHGVYAVEDNNNVTLKDCVIDDAGSEPSGYGVYLTNRLSDASLDGVTVRTQGRCVYITASSNILLRSCTISSEAGEAVYLGGTSSLIALESCTLEAGGDIVCVDIQAPSCSVRDCKVVGGSWGIAIRNTAIGTSLINTRVLGEQEYAIRLGGSVSHNIISQNHCESPVLVQGQLNIVTENIFSGGFTDAGTGNVVANNITD